MNFVRLGNVQNGTKIFELTFALWAATGRVHENQIQVRKPIEGRSQLALGRDDFHGQVDDIRVGL